MKTKKQRDHQRERRNRKRAERWERDVATPQLVTLMLLDDNNQNTLYLKYVSMQRASALVRYRNRNRIMRQLEYELARRTRKYVVLSVPVYTSHD